MDLILKKLFDGGDLTFEETRILISEIMRGEHGTAVVAGILMALKIKGEGSAEIGGAARALQDAALPVAGSSRGPMIRNRLVMTSLRKAPWPAATNASSATRSWTNTTSASPLMPRRNAAPVPRTTARTSTPDCAVNFGSR